MNNKESCVMVLLSFIFSLVVGTIMGGWALAKLWLWFVVPLFAVPELSIAQAVGLSLVIGYMTKSPVSNKENKDIDALEASIQSILLAIGLPLITLGLGWIIKGFL